MVQSMTKISQEHKKILDERLKAHKNNPDDVVSWGEVKKKLVVYFTWKTIDSIVFRNQQKSCKISNNWKN